MHKEFLLVLIYKPVQLVLRRGGGNHEHITEEFVDRVTSSIKKYQRIAQAQQKSDVAEADTATLVKDIFSDVFGYDKYEDLTSEHQIKSTYCDLAIKIGGKLRLLVEVKSAGSTLSDNHLKQVIDYGAHQGIHWVVLTNAVEAIDPDLCRQPDQP